MTPRLFIDGPSLAGSAETLTRIGALSVPPRDYRYPHAPAAPTDARHAIVVVAELVDERR